MQRLSSLKRSNHIFRFGLHVERLLRIHAFYFFFFLRSLSYSPSSFSLYIAFFPKKLIPFLSQRTFPRPPFIYLTSLRSGSSPQSKGLRKSPFLIRPIITRSKNLRWPSWPNGPPGAEARDPSRQDAEQARREPAQAAGRPPSAVPRVHRQLRSGIAIPFAFSRVERMVRDVLSLVVWESEDLSRCLDRVEWSSGRVCFQLIRRFGRRVWFNWREWRECDVRA